MNFISHLKVVRKRKMGKANWLALVNTVAVRPHIPPNGKNEQIHKGLPTRMISQSVWPVVWSHEEIKEIFRKRDKDSTWVSPKTILKAFFWLCFQVASSGQALLSRRKASEKPQLLLESELVIYLFRFFLQISVFLSRILIFWNGCSLIFVGYGGYSYLLEPLWWVGFITSKFSCLFFRFLFHVLIFQKPTYSLQIVVIWNFIVIVLVVDMDSKLWLYGLLSSSTFHFAIEFKCFSMAIILLHRGSFVSVWF